MNQPGDDPRLMKLVDLIVEFASGDMSVRMEPSAARDTIDAVITGINLLAEELQQMYGDLEARVVERTAALEAAQEQLKQLALTDSLTGLANRNLLGDRISQALMRADRGGLPPAVILIDLDEFKLINDSLGHSAGDAVLVEVAQRLREVVRDTDTVGRLGGDEFAIVLPDTAEAVAMRVARRTLEALQKPVSISPREVTVTASIGLRIGLRGQTGESLLRDADIAMYRAKALGKSNVQVFEPAMGRASQQRMEVSSELSRAIERDELSMHYQPIVQLVDGSMIGAEALLRWEHSTNGLTYPRSFISIAEDSGLIADLGKWTLGTAIRTLRGWLQALPASSTFTLHVNISPSELRRPGLVDFVRHTLDQYQVPPCRLALEIAETGLMSGDARGMQTLVELTKLGVSVQIDDFGTGYSSIAYLRELPVDTVKIDQSLTSGIADDPGQRGFVRAILHLIEAAGLRAIVEGVETAAQRAELLKVGAQFGQGYFFSRPMPETDLVALLESTIESASERRSIPG